MVYILTWNSNQDGLGSLSLTTIDITWNNWQPEKSHVVDNYERNENEGPLKRDVRISFSPYHYSFPQCDWVGSTLHYLLLPPSTSIKLTGTCQGVTRDASFFCYWLLRVLEFGMVLIARLPSTMEILFYFIRSGIVY